MQIEDVEVSQLAAMAAPYNPRTISEHDLVALGHSMTTFGVVEPVVVNRRTGRIVGGHQRVAAAAAQGIDPAYTDVIVQRWQQFSGKKAEGWRGNG